VQTTALPKETDDSDSEVSLMFRARDGKGAADSTLKLSAFTTDGLRVETTNLSTGMASRFAPSHGSEPDLVLAVDRLTREGSAIAVGASAKREGFADDSLPQGLQRRGDCARTYPRQRRDDITSASRTICIP